MRAFQPISTQVISVAATTQRVALSGSDTEIRLHNTGASAVWYLIGDSGVNAAVIAADTNGPEAYIPAGATQIISRGVSGTHIATIGAGGTSTLIVTHGRGVHI